MLCGRQLVASSFEASFDSAAFLVWIGEQGIAPLVFQALLEQDMDHQVPRVLLEGLRERVRREAATELLRNHDLRRLQSGLRQAGIPMLLLKGSALAYTHYPSPTLRPRVDSDIYIDMADMQRIRPVLRNLGYELQAPFYKSRQFGCYRLGAEGRILAYDIHWRINNAPRFARLMPFAECWQNSVRIAGFDELHTLGPVDSLLLACIHLAGSLWHDAERLIWLYDLHLLVSSMDSTQLACFAERAVNCGVQQACLQVLERAASCFGEPLSVMLREQLSSAGPEHTRWSGSTLRLIIDDLRSVPGWRSCIGLLAEYLYPGSDYLLDRYAEDRRSRLPALYLRYLVTSARQRLLLK